MSRGSGPDSAAAVREVLAGVHPFDDVAPQTLASLSQACHIEHYDRGQSVYAAGEDLSGIYLVRSGEVEVRERGGGVVSRLGPGDVFGERGLLRDGRAATSATATRACELIVIPTAQFTALVGAHESFARLYDRTRRHGGQDISFAPVTELLRRDPVSCGPLTTVAQAARLMREHRISSLGVVEDDALVGILTVRDLSSRVVADELDPTATTVDQVMTADPRTLPSTALGADLLRMMLAEGIGHLPIVDDGRLVGMVTQTDLTRYQAASADVLVRDITTAASLAQVTRATGTLPALLHRLVAANTSHEIVTRRITEVADSVTRRLLAEAEQRLGPPPVPYLWAACGSQGRREQTGVGDQDNGLVIDDAMRPEDDAYFAELARLVSDGLHACGYVYCSGGMMATTTRWRQPVRVWREYFDRWIAHPDPKAQMLASVMFDLRPIAGDVSLFTALQHDTLRAASANQIFVAHMISNSLLHEPPLGMLRGISTIRSGAHRHHVDLKHTGVIPVVDLGRIYALRGQISSVNTRERLLAAEASGVISAAGGRDLIAAYDLIATMRLEHQARQIAAGRPPDNFLDPTDLSDFERGHLRDAFVVVRTMQQAAGAGTNLLR